MPAAAGFVDERPPFRLAGGLFCRFRICHIMHSFAGGRPALSEPMLGEKMPSLPVAADLRLHIHLMRLSVNLGGSLLAKRRDNAGAQLLTARLARSETGPTRMLNAPRLASGRKSIDIRAG